MLQRTWTHTQSSSGSPRVLWDLGSLQWELWNGVLRHWSVISRNIVSKEPPIIQELLQLLPESPVPLEAVEQTVQNWVIAEQVLPEVAKEQLQVKGQVQQRHKVPATKQEHKGPSLPREPKQVQEKSKGPNQTSREKPQPKDAASQATHSSQDSADHPSRRIPSELWSSLSQWIPPERFYQPSLHHQASAELSEQPTPTSAHRSCQRPYSQQRPGQRPPPGRGRPASFSQQRAVVQQPKGLPHAVSQTRPLLV